MFTFSSYNMSCAEMASKVGVAHKISRALTRGILKTPLNSILDPPLTSSDCVEQFYSMYFAMLGTGRTENADHTAVIPTRDSGTMI